MHIYEHEMFQKEEAYLINCLTMKNADFSISPILNWVLPTSFDILI